EEEQKSDSERSQRQREASEADARYALWSKISEEHRTEQGYDMQAIALDPGLDEQGRLQARRMLERLGRYNRAGLEEVAQALLLVSRGPAGPPKCMKPRARFGAGQVGQAVPPADRAKPGVAGWVSTEPRRDPSRRLALRAVTPPAVLSLRTQDSAG